MFTHKDITARTIFVINCLDHDRNLRVSNGELLLEQKNEGQNYTLTKIPFQKVLALFIVGHISLTSPLIEKCRKYNVALVVMKPNLRPVFYWSDTAEANYLLRQRQYAFDKNDLSIARILVYNKIQNQEANLRKTRRKDTLTIQTLQQIKTTLNLVAQVDDYNMLMGIEGRIAKLYFAAYFQDLEWTGRKPRMKSDILNVTLDIGYTILFNFIECYIRMFGFDLYVGVYHRLWFKRKSLVCDLIEPFRCIIDHTILLAFKRKQFQSKDFELVKNEYKLKYNECAKYYRVFYDALIEYKKEFFLYIQTYYRCFMGRRSATKYPSFIF